MPEIFFPSSKPIFVDTEKIIAEIRKLALKLVKKNSKVREVYLFGSYAEGQALPRSDADVLIVLSEDSRRVIDRLDEFILEFIDAPVPVDVLVYTKKEIEKGVRENNPFLLKALSGIRVV
jgi:predicted nucleotidyltransferase